MGEDEAMEYDSEKIFRHLYGAKILCPLDDDSEYLHSRCFYLDSPRNARRNGMEVKAKYEEQIATSYGLIL